MFTRVTILGGPAAVAALNGLPTDATILQIAAPILGAKLRVSTDDGVSVDLVATTEEADAWADATLSAHVWAALPEHSRGKPTADAFGITARRVAFVDKLHELPTPPADARHVSYWAATCVALGDAFGLDDGVILLGVRDVFGVDVSDALATRGKLPFPYDGMGKAAEKDARVEAERDELARVKRETAAREAAEAAARKVPVDPSKFWRLLLRCTPADAPKTLQGILHGFSIRAPRGGRIYLFRSPGFSAPDCDPSPLWSWLGPEVETLATGAELAAAAPVTLDLLARATPYRQIQGGPVATVDYSTSKGRAFCAAAADFLAERRDLMTSLALEVLMTQILVRGFTLRPEVAAHLYQRTKEAIYPAPQVPQTIVATNAPPRTGAMPDFSVLGGAKKLGTPTFHDYRTVKKERSNGFEMREIEVREPYEREVTPADVARLSGHRIPGMSPNDFLAVCRAAAAGNGEVLVSPGECVPALSPTLLERAKVKLLGGRFAPQLRDALRDEDETTLTDAAEYLRNAGIIPSTRELSPQERSDVATSLQSIGFRATRKVTEAGHVRIYVRDAAEAAE